MPPRKRLKDDNEGASDARKRVKPAPSTRRSTRSSATRPVYETTSNTNGNSKWDSAPKLPEDDPLEISSDSSSLSDPPSVISSPTPQKARPLRTVPNGKPSKRIVTQSKPVRETSSKENEEALNLFIREDSEDDDSSDARSDTKQANGEIIDLSGDDEDEDWEDIDLSRHKQVSYDDLNANEETPDLEVTLERTQQSMRIKYILSRGPV